jgi:hypothetical protein
MISSFGIPVAVLMPQRLGNTVIEDTNGDSSGTVEFLNG